MPNDVNRKVYKKEWQYQEGEYTVTRTTQWSGPGCHNGCGVLFYTKDNKLLKVEGDPDNPVYDGRLCMRCLALPEAVNHPDRLLYPMKRVGERGENKWERITWDEAYDTIVAKVRQIQKHYSPKSICSLMGTGRNATWQTPALSWNAFKSPNNVGGFLSGDSCYTPRLAVMSALFGDVMIADCAQLLEKRYDDPRYRVPEIILVWANNPIVSNPDGFMGHWIVDLMKRGSRLIVVDPRLTWLAAKADIWLQPRPGTDAALALGMLNVVINEGLYDQEFIDKWTYGFEQLKERVQEYPPEKAAEICWVPKEKIVEAARLYAKAKLTSLQWGLAMDQSQHAVATCHAVCSLWTLSGNVDVPGGNVIVTTGYVQADIRKAVTKAAPPDIGEGRLGDDEYPFRKHTYAGHALPDAMLTAIESGKPYPIKMLWICSTNTFANMGAEARRVYEAMKKVPFIVVADLFMTPTAVACADIVLPVAMSCERMGVRGWWSPLRAISKVIKTGEAKSDEQIALELGKRLEPEAFPWENEEEMLDYCMKNLTSIPFDITFKELQEKVYIYPEFEYLKHEKGLLRADGEVGFNTATGRIEFYSTLFEAVGLDPLPYYKEPPESPVSTPELAKEYPFVLTTGQRSYEFFHSEHRQLKSMREFHPDPIVEMNSEDAKQLGIKDGDWVWIENRHGKCKQKARLNPGMLKGVVSGEHGWWFPEKPAAEPSLFGVWESNINLLTTQCQIGPAGLGAPYRCQICKVYKA